MKNRSLDKTGNKQAVDNFLTQVKNTPLKTQTPSSGRLIFALDATASRQATWDQACQLQSEMFVQAQQLNGLSIQLCYYRGFNEFYASHWLNDSNQLLQQMNQVSCAGGYTQIARLLQHALKETQQKKVNALAFIGDCVEEDVDKLCNLAGQAGIMGLPLFIFQEGYDVAAQTCFQQMANLSQGAYARFDQNSAAQLSALIQAVAIFSSGGRSAFKNHLLRHPNLAKQLTHQIS
ncbi:MAG: VWA domain-containing protein [Gammaproteobacteria bacterium]|nr:VWA domain-containing protein [Gammaproteobacteria bacterium]MDH5731245.1 VWA domain-containing protein [Gammaproteobacteria bacterium]